MLEDDPFRDIPPTLTIPIDPPVAFEGREYGQIILREPRAGQVRQADEQVRGGVTMAAMRTREHHLVASVSGLPFPVVERLPVSRVTLAMEYLNRFLAVGRQTGGT